MLLKIGIVGRALGLQGSFYVSGRDEPMPESVKSVKIGKTDATAKEAKILKSFVQNGRPVILCDLANDRNSAELLTGMFIWAESHLISVHDDKEFLLSDLKGREVFDANGVHMGMIEDVVKMPASVNIIVVNPSRSSDLEIPVISDYVDMSFKRGEANLRLTVSCSVFEEIWNSRAKNES
jgi:ribosomal 30S subunit maturation factor RimM